MNKVEKPGLNFGKRISLAAFAFVGIGCNRQEKQCSRPPYSWDQKEACVDGNKKKTGPYCCLNSTYK